MIRALLIDLDGTIIDSMPALYRTYLNILQERGITGNQEEFDRLTGFSLSEIARALKATYGWKESYEVIFSRYLTLLHHHYVLSPLTFPGVEEVIRYAKQQGMLISLVTSSPALLAYEVLKKVNLFPLFDYIITPEGLPQSKPNPAIYLKALQATGVSANEALAIEDSQNGIRAAQGAGIPTLSFRFPGGTLRVDSWGEILKFLTEREHESV